MLSAIMFNVIMLSVIMLSAVLPSVIMPSVIMLTVIMLSVEASNFTDCMLSLAHRDKQLEATSSQKLCAKNPQFLM
jgi:hypothetical protein